MPAPVYLAQITDCHLQNNPAQRYRERDVERCFEQVLSDLQHRYPKTQHLLLTGDLVHQGGAAGYHRLLSTLQRVAVPCHWIPGNHDDGALMQRLGGPLNKRSFTARGWGIILLDSTAHPDGRGSGSLGEDELLFLQQQLSAFQKRHCLVVLHHNPLPVQSAWQDAIGLGNADAFWAVAEGHPQLRGVLCGHVHQAWDIERRGVRVLSCPASSVQFKKCATSLTLEDDPELALPAYRVLALQADGQIETHIQRVAVDGCAA